MIQNDTFGEITEDELRALRDKASTCTTCGMLATVDPVFHQARYGHAPTMRADAPQRCLNCGSRQGESCMDWCAYKPDGRSMYSQRDHSPAPVTGVGPWCPEGCRCGQPCCDSQTVSLATIDPE